MSAWIEQPSELFRERIRPGDSIKFRVVA
jgi:hypothetical protein